MQVVDDNQSRGWRCGDDATTSGGPGRLSEQGGRSKVPRYLKPTVEWKVGELEEYMRVILSWEDRRSG